MPRIEVVKDARTGLVTTRDLPDPTAEEVAAGLAVARASAALPIADFALACLAAGHLTEQEAEDWVSGNGLPAWVTSAIAGLPAGQRPAARIRIKGATVVRRASPEVAILAAAKGLSASAVDALFGIA